MRELPLGDLYEFSSREVQQLLHNKFVVILGDSVHRTIYKDLVYFLQYDRLAKVEELKAKAVPTFYNDRLVEWDGLHNKTCFREARQYRTDHHLVRVYFISRVYTDYMESILEDFKAGPAPDLLILNSCLWDLNRYNKDGSKESRLERGFQEYRKNLQTLFKKLHVILPTSCLVIWDTTMPLGRNVKKAFLQEGMENLATPDIILKANFESATLACCFQFDVLDLNFCFRFLQEHRALDGVHWDSWVHRCITKLLLTHVARAWGVDLQNGYPQNGIPWNGNADPYLWPRHQPNPSFHCDTIPESGSFSGFVNFEDDRQFQACPEEPQYGGSHGPAGYAPNGGQGIPYGVPVGQVPDEGWGFPPHWESPDYRVAEMQHRGFHGPADYAPDGGQAVPYPIPVGQVPDGGWTFSFPSHARYMPNGGPVFPPPLPRGSPRGFRGRHCNGRVIRHQRSSVEHFRPYSHPFHGPGGHPRFRPPPPPRRERLVSPRSVAEPPSNFPYGDEGGETCWDQSSVASGPRRYPLLTGWQE